MKDYHLRITTPTGVSFDERAVQLSVRAVDGELAVLAGHIPIVTVLTAGECRVYQSDGNMRTADYDGGVLTVTNDRVDLLTAKFNWK